MKSSFRRLIRFVNDPRYRVFYSPPPVSPKEYWDAIDARTLAYQLSVGADPEPGAGLYWDVAYWEFWYELHPLLEWPDYLGNVLFRFFCLWVLVRAFVSPAGPWLLLPTFALVMAKLVRLWIELCREVWRTWISCRKSH